MIGRFFYLPVFYFIDNTCVLGGSSGAPDNSYVIFYRQDAPPEQQAAGCCGHLLPRSGSSGASYL